MTVRFECLKCGHQEYKMGQLRAAGGFWSKIFDVQNKKFETVTCTRCGYTELYNLESSTAGNVFDFFTS